MSCHICGSEGLYTCYFCGNYVCNEHIRFALICSNCFKRRDVEFSIREASIADKKFISELVRKFWGEDLQISFGQEFIVKDLPAYVSIVHDEIAGFISFCNFNKSDMLIVALAVLPEYQGLGIGKALVSAVENKARELSKERLIVSTSNDDVLALLFYQSIGFRIYEIVPNVIAEKHGEVIKGQFEIPVLDEIRLYKTI